MEKTYKCFGRNGCLLANGIKAVSMDQAHRKLEEHFENGPLKYREWASAGFNIVEGDGPCPFVPTRVLRHANYDTLQKEIMELQGIMRTVECAVAEHDQELSDLNEKIESVDNFTRKADQGATIQGDQLAKRITDNDGELRQLICDLIERTDELDMKFGKITNEWRNERPRHVESWELDKILNEDGMQHLPDLDGILKQTDMRLQELECRVLPSENDQSCANWKGFPRQYLVARADKAIGELANELGRTKFAIRIQLFNYLASILKQGSYNGDYNGFEENPE